MAKKKTASKPSNAAPEEKSYALVFGDDDGYVPVQVNGVAVDLDVGDMMNLIAMAQEECGCTGEAAKHWRADIKYWKTLSRMILEAGILPLTKCSNRIAQELQRVAVEAAKTVKKNGR